MKRYRFLALALVLALVAPVLLAVPVSAAVATPDWCSYDTFSATNIQTYSSTSRDEALMCSSSFKSLLYHAYYSRSAVVYVCNDSYLSGYFWDDYGRLVRGKWTNSLGQAHASVLGVFPLSDLSLVSSFNVTAYPFFFSKELAEEYSDYLTARVFAIDWSVETGDHKFHLFFKSASDSTWSGTADLGMVYYPSAVLSPCYLPTDSGIVYGSSSALEVPNVPVLTTSFDGQFITIAENEVARFFIMAEGINGVPSVTWYSLREADDGSFVRGDVVFADSMVSDSSGRYFGAYRFVPNAELAPYTVHFMAEVTNTIGSSSATAQSDLVTIKVFSYDDTVGGDSSGDTEDSGSTETDSETLGKLEELDTDIQEVQEAVSAVGDKLDDLTVQVGEEMEQVQDQLEESNNKLEEVVEGVTSLPQKIGDMILGLFVPSEEDMAGIKDQWAQLLSDRFGAVYDAVAIVDEIASSFREQTTQGTITFPSVSIPLSGVDFEFGGWEVDVVPDGLEFFIEIVKKAIDIVCTLLFVNGMKSRYEKTLEGRG